MAESDAQVCEYEMRSVLGKGMYDYEEYDYEEPRFKRLDSRASKLPSLQSIWSGYVKYRSTGRCVAATCQGAQLVLWNQ